MSDKISTFKNSVSGLTRNMTQKEADRLNWAYEQQLKRNPYGCPIRWEKVEEK